MAFLTPRAAENEPPRSSARKRFSQRLQAYAEQDHMATMTAPKTRPNAFLSSNAVRSPIRTA